MHASTFAFFVEIKQALSVVIGHEKVTCHNARYFFIHFNVPFKIISLIETIEPIDGWGEMGVPRENHLKHPQAELVLSHMWPVRGSNLHQTQR